MKANTTVPSGFPEWSRPTEALHQHWLEQIRKAFALHGFAPIETPLCERMDNLTNKGGNAKEIYALARLHAAAGDPPKAVGLRFDHTVPLALYVTRHRHEIAFPFARSVIGPVLRGERAQRGRYRQFTQCDIDIIGQESLSLQADARVIAALCAALRSLNCGAFVVRMNNRKLLQGALEHFGVAADLFAPALKIIDDLEKMPAAKALQQLIDMGLAAENAQQVLNFCQHKGALPDYDNALYNEGKEELEIVAAALVALGVPAHEYRIDTGIARGLDYYTGTVMETHLIGHESVGSIASGGRYADLAGSFGGTNMPGVGMSIGLTRLISIVQDLPIAAQVQAHSLDCLLVPYAPEQLADCCALESQLRAAGVRVATYFEDKKLKKKMQYAEKMQTPWVAILGEDEQAEGTITLKNMATGGQQKIAQAALAGHLAATL